MKMNRDMMRQIQQMQSRLAKAQEELNSLTAEGSAGGGAVKITVTGNLQVQSLKISPEVIDPEDVEMLEDLVTAALNEALQNAQALQAQHMAGLTAGLNLPGMP
jgi:DNA-binding YbaB/EbfC family protein